MVPARRTVDRGRVFSWGFGKNGALGLGTTESRCSPQRVECFGKLKEPVRTTACGSHHTGFITAEGRLYMCGANHAGQLGNPTHEMQLTPVPVQDVSDRVTQVACGVLHSLILTGKLGRLTTRGWGCVCGGR